ncbi:MAG: ATP-binding cassette domain-containing protein [Actinomycetota bacterium]
MSDVVLSVNNITKRFGAVEALADVSFEIEAGSITGLIGDNGAGKSTMVKIISGIMEPSEGELLLGGERLELTSPLDARSAGIETVHQSLALVEEFDVGENFYLGREMSTWGPIRLCQTKKMARQAEESMRNLGINLPGGVRRKVRSMSGGQRQAVAIARASFWQSRLLLLDEPTAALGVRESNQVNTLVRRLAEQGAAILLISHNMEDVASLCSKAVVLRQGRRVGHLTGDFSAEDCVAYVTGARSDLTADASTGLLDS